MLEGVRRLLNPDKQAFYSDRFFLLQFQPGYAGGCGVRISLGSTQKKAEWFIDYYRNREVAGVEEEEVIDIVFAPPKKSGSKRNPGEVIHLAAGRRTSTYQNGTELKVSQEKFAHRAVELLTCLEKVHKDALERANTPYLQEKRSGEQQALKTLKEKVTILNASENDIVYGQENFIPDGGPHTNGDVIYGPRRQSP